MGAKIFINNQLVPEEEAKVSVFDHGLLYGDGVFEGIRSYRGRVFELKAHVKRLYESAHSLMLNLPLTMEEMERSILDTVRANQLEDAYIRVVVTRGAGDLGLDPNKCAGPTVIIIAGKVNLYPQELYKKGLKVITVPTRRNIPDALDPQIKSLNYLNNKLVKIEANHAGAMEAITMNINGHIAEGSSDNVFIVKDGVLVTPPTYVGALKGITRNVVIKLAVESNIEVKEVPFTRHDLYVADECFLTGTAAEVIPVVEVDRRRIGEGIPGKTTMLLTGKFKEYAYLQGVPVYGGKEAETP